MLLSTMTVTDNGGSLIQGYVIDLVEENLNTVVPRINIANFLLLGNFVAQREKSSDSVSYGRPVTSTAVKYVKV